MYIPERALWGAMWQIGRREDAGGRETSEGPDLGQLGIWGLRLQGGVGWSQVSAVQAAMVLAEMRSWGRKRS